MVDTKGCVSRDFWRSNSASSCCGREAYEEMSSDGNCLEKYFVFQEWETTKLLGILLDSSLMVNVSWQDAHLIPDEGINGPLLMACC